MAWVCWFFLAPHFYLFDGFVASWLPVRLDLGLALCVLLALHVRTSALPGLLFFAALARSVLFGGDLALHFLAMGVPIALVLPLRGMFFWRSVFWQSAIAGLLAVAIPQTGAIVARLGRQPESGLGGADHGGFGTIVSAMVFVPLLVALLRRLPPLRSFVERSE